MIDLITGLKNSRYYRCRFGKLRQDALTALVVTGIALILISCASVSSTPTVAVNADKNWALLPFSNLSVTPRAEDQLAEIVETSLRSRGVGKISIYQPERKAGLRSLFDDSAQMQVASRWALRQGQDYAITGSVHEWQYRVDADKEPTVGITLKLIHVSSGDVLWQGNAARTSLGLANLPALAGKVVDSLLDEVTIVNAH